MATEAAPQANGHANGTAEGERTTKKYNVEIEKQPGSHGKPDKAHHDKEMDRLKKGIEKVQAEVVSAGNTQNAPVPGRTLTLLLPHSRTKCEDCCLEEVPPPTPLKANGEPSCAPNWTN